MFEANWLTPLGYASIFDVVELSALRVEYHGRSVGIETTTAELRAAFGPPDSLRIAQFARFNPETDPDWANDRPTSWLYPSFDFLVLPDSTAVFANLITTQGAALIGDEFMLDQNSRLSDLVRQFPDSWRCHKGHPDNYPGFLFDLPDAEAFTVIDTSATPEQRYWVSKLTLVFEDGALVRVFD